MMLRANLSPLKNDMQMSEIPQSKGYATSQHYYEKNYNLDPISTWDCPSPLIWYDTLFPQK